MRFVTGDDNGIARGILKGAIVVDCKFELVGAARNGQEAIDLCEKLLPDVVILDINMPPMNGDAAARIIRDKGYAKHIILASLAMQKRSEAQAEGFGFIAKPFKREQLAREIMEQLRGAD